MEKKLLYIGIATLSAFVTDENVMQCMNEPVIITSMTPFQWAIIALRSVLAGLIVWKAYVSNPNQETKPNENPENTTPVGSPGAGAA